MTLSPERLDRFMRLLAVREYREAFFETHDPADPSMEPHEQLRQEWNRRHPGEEIPEAGYGDA